MTGVPNGAVVDEPAKSPRRPRVAGFVRVRQRRGRLPGAPAAAECRQLEACVAQERLELTALELRRGFGGSISIPSSPSRPATAMPLAKRPA